MYPMVARRNVFSGNDYAFMCKNANNLLDIKKLLCKHGEFASQLPRKVNAKASEQQSPRFCRKKIQPLRLFFVILLKNNSSERLLRCVGTQRAEDGTRDTENQKIEFARSRAA